MDNENLTDILQDVARRAEKAGYNKNEHAGWSDAENDNKYCLFTWRCNATGTVKSYAVVTEDLQTFIQGEKSAKEAFPYLSEYDWVLLDAQLVNNILPEFYENPKQWMPHVMGDRIVVSGRFHNLPYQLDDLDGMVLPVTGIRYVHRNKWGLEATDIVLECSVRQGKNSYSGVFISPYAAGTDGVTRNPDTEKDAVDIPFGNAELFVPYAPTHAACDVNQPMSTICTVCVPPLNEGDKWKISQLFVARVPGKDTARYIDNKRTQAQHQCLRHAINGIGYYADRTANPATVTQFQNLPVNGTYRGMRTHGNCVAKEYRSVFYSAPPEHTKMKARLNPLVFLVVNREELPFVAENIFYDVLDYDTGNPSEAFVKLANSEGTEFVVPRWAIAEATSTFTGDEDEPLDVHVAVKDGRYVVGEAEFAEMGDAVQWFKHKHLNSKSVVVNNRRLYSFKQQLEEALKAQGQ